jgi:hypothetical protein
MSLASSTAAAQAVQAKIDPLLAPAQRSWDQLDRARQQLASLQQGFERDAARFEKDVNDHLAAAKAEADRALQTVADIAPVVAAWADYLVKRVWIAGENLARWTYDARFGPSPYADADERILGPISQIYSQADDAGKMTLDQIREGVRKVKKCCDELDSAKKEWERHNDEIFNNTEASNKLLFLRREAAKRSLPTWPPP